MANFDVLAWEFPRITLLDIRLLKVLNGHPGLSIAELAELARIDYRTCQERVAILATGRKRRHGKASYGFIAAADNFADKRKKSLSLTDSGEQFISRV
ncbi:MAG: winged helix-turn-helix transcriptional regulator [Victivallaceae bacterium]